MPKEIEVSYTQSKLVKQAFAYFLCQEHGFFCTAQVEAEYENCPECLRLCEKNDTHHVYVVE